MSILKNIVKGSTAKLSHVCNGKVFYQIQTKDHLYQLELDSCDADWKATYLFPEFKSINLMRWIRKGLELNDGTLNKLN
jgi:hypothetical protein